MPEAEPQPQRVGREDRGAERVAAGAREVFPPTPRKLMAFHPLGTARAAARPEDGVVDADGQVHGVRNLYVSDGSAVPTALGVNPQLTIMALARRLAVNLIE